jgi:hypothetical protein
MTRAAEGCFFVCPAGLLRRWGLKETLPLDQQENNL